MWPGGSSHWLWSDEQYIHWNQKKKHEYSKHLNVHQSAPAQKVLLTEGLFCLPTFFLRLFPTEEQCNKKEPML
jgi:hypothetical protein